nr:AAA family ATPase [uncultured Devosia sp.]
MSALAELKKKADADHRRIDDYQEMGQALGEAMVEASLEAGALERLRGGGPYAAIVLVPTSSHITMVADALSHMLPDEAQVSIVGEAGIATSESLLDGLRDNGVVVAVTAQIREVPLQFRAQADATMKIGAHDADAVTRAMETFLGTAPPPFPLDFVPHPNPHVVCGCVASGLPIDRTMQALIKLGEMSRSKSEPVLPPLDECIEFGEARRWGLQVIEDLKAWRDGRIPASDLDGAALLVSPPGHGKTMFARVMARAMQAPLIELTVGDLFKGDGHLGPVLQELNSVFAKATAAAPAVLFLDELDSFYRRDAADSNRSFTTSVINELLTLLDGSTGRAPGLVVLAATNLPESIDPALLRPGRLSRTIHLPRPDAPGIAHILRTHLRGDLEGADIRRAVDLASGSTAAELMDAVRTARRLARADGVALNVGLLERALTDFEEHDDDLLHRIAVHEAGHALAAFLLPHAPIVRSLSIVPRGKSNGRVDLLEAPGARTRASIQTSIMIHLAGRAAEQIVFGDDPSDGATSDLRTATRLAAALHGQLGMGDSLIHHDSLANLLLTDRDFAARIAGDLEILFKTTTQLIGRHQGILTALSDALLQDRVLSGFDAARIVQGRGKWEVALSHDKTIGTVQYRTLGKRGDHHEC